MSNNSTIDLSQHQLLWMNENPLYQATGYWRDQNIGHCYLDMLSDLESKLRGRKLTNYFKGDGENGENILDGVEIDVIKELEGFITERRKLLLHIGYEDIPSMGLKAQ